MPAFAAWPVFWVSAVNQSGSAEVKHQESTWNSASSSGTGHLVDALALLASPSESTARQT